MLLAFIGVTLIAGEPRYEDNFLSILLVVGGAFTWAVLFLGETLTAYTVAGGALAIGGVAIINLWPAGGGSRAAR